MEGSSLISLPLESPLRDQNFIFGIATSSFQIEGASTTDGRLASIWDQFCQKPGAIKDGSNGDIACDHYHLWRQDLALIAELGVDSYRFSIAWPRVMLKNGELNPVGVAFYQSILSELERLNIKAFVTLYHWDLPQYLEDEGGWLNRNTAYAFADYADKITQALRGPVYSWATLNEPFCSAYLGYQYGIHAPGLVGEAYGKKAAHHLLLAHGLGMQVLRKNCPNSLNGLVLNFAPCYPASTNPEDEAAARLADDHNNQWFIQPVIEGSYPDLLAQLPIEHRPDILPGDMELISAPLDFLGVNYYSRAVYKDHQETGYQQWLPSQVELTAMGWEVYPQGLTDLLVQLHQRYKLPDIYITENGAATDDHLVDGQVNDEQRVRYLQTHLEALHEAALQGVPLKGYFAWSLMDNFEWAEGYLKRFGLVYVDYQTQQRIKKQSAIALQQMLAGRKALAQNQTDAV
jgi:beta-glucosidase